MSKLTLNFKSNYISRMRQYAKRKNKSISKLIEEHFDFLLPQENEKQIVAEEFFRDIVGIWKGRNLTKNKLRKLGWKHAR